jgi:hypothetical protein
MFGKRDGPLLQASVNTSSNGVAHFHQSLQHVASRRTTFSSIMYKMFSVNTGQRRFDVMAMPCDKLMVPTSFDIFRNTNMATLRQCSCLSSEHARGKHSRIAFQCRILYQVNRNYFYILTSQRTMYAKDL